MDEKFPLALPEGSVLAGQYIIQKTLGQGGFGITYMAIDHKTNQKVAVKEFFPDTLATRSQTTVIPHSGERGDSYNYGLACFLQEAETLAEFIGIDSIVKIHSYFEENGTAYFVMDFVEGQSFDEYIKARGGKISYEEAEPIFVNVMDALASVHSKGIVHRDVTPDNIYITNEGQVKLLDFGAARYSLGDKSRSLDVVLKHGFAPKEQYTRHGKQGPFTDIYSLGASFYFAITGKRPPDSIDRLEVDDLVPPSRLGVQISAAKEEAILKAMGVQPNDRFQSMEQFKQALLYADSMQNAQQNYYQDPNQAQQAYGYGYDQNAYGYQDPNQMQQAYGYDQNAAYGYNQNQYQQQNMASQEPVKTNPSQPAKKKPVWIIPVAIGGGVFAVLALVVIIIIAIAIGGGRRDRNNTTTEDYANYDLTTEYTTEFTTEATTVEITTEQATTEETTTEATTEEQVSYSAVGIFDSLATNNVVNCGFMAMDNSNMWFYYPGKGLCYYDGNEIKTKYETSNELTSINIVGDKIYFLENHKAYYCEISTDYVYDVTELSDFDNIYTLVVNDYGCFMVQKKDDENFILNYYSWTDGLRAYYYNVSNEKGIAIAGEYIYYISKDKHTLYKQLVKTFGDNGQNALQVVKNDGVTMNALAAEDNYIYFSANYDSDGEAVCRVNVNNSEWLYATVGLEGSRYVSAINVYKGYVYYSTADWTADPYFSEVWKIQTTSTGWSSNAYTKIFDDTSKHINLYALCVDPTNTMIVAGGYNSEESKSVNFAMSPDPDEKNNIVTFE